MSEPATNYIDFDTGFQKVDRGGVAKQVRADSPRLWAVRVPQCSMSSNDLVDTEARQGSVSYCTEDIAVRQCMLLREQLLKTLNRLLPEWADTPLIAFAVQMNLGWRGEIEMFHAKIGNLLYAGSRVVQKEQ